MDRHLNSFYLTLILINLDLDLLASFSGIQAYRSNGWAEYEFDLDPMTFLDLLKQEVDMVKMYLCTMNKVPSCSGLKVRQIDFEVFMYKWCDQIKIGWTSSLTCKNLPAPTRPSSPTCKKHHPPQHTRNTLLLPMLQCIKEPPPKLEKNTLLLTKVKTAIYWMQHTAEWNKERRSMIFPNIWQC